MLTAKERAQMIKLQKKAATHEPMAPEQVDQTEERCAAIVQGSLHGHQAFIEAINVFNTMLGELSMLNIQLVADVRYWREQAEQAKEEA